MKRNGALARGSWRIATLTIVTAMPHFACADRLGSAQAGPTLPVPQRVTVHAPGTWLEQRDGRVDRTHDQESPGVIEFRRGADYTFVLHRPSGSVMEGRFLDEVVGQPALTGFQVGYFQAFSDENLRSVARLTPLRHLSVQSPSFTGHTLGLLRRLPRLESLTLYNTQVSEPGLRHLCRRPPPSLVELHLQASPIQDADLHHLRTIPTLRHLSLVQMPIRGSGLASLASLELETLSLRHGRITSEGVIEGVARLTTLRHLDLAGNRNIGPRALEALTSLQALTSLDLSTLLLGRHGHFAGPELDAASVARLLRDVPALQSLALDHNPSVTEEVEAVLSGAGTLEHGRWTREPPDSGG